MNYRWGLGAFGFGALDYYGLLAQANLQNCDPHDEACVADNVAKQAAVEDYWVQHMATGVPDNTQLTFASLTPGQVAAFASPGSANVGNVVPTGIMQVGTWTSAPETPVITPLPSPAVPPAAPAPKATGTTPAPSPAAPSPSSSAASSSETTLTSTFTLPHLGGLAIPWWGWAAAAGVALFAFGGGRGR